MEHSVLGGEESLQLLHAVGESVVGLTGLDEAHVDVLGTAVAARRDISVEITRLPLMKRHRTAVLLDVARETRPVERRPIRPEAVAAARRVLGPQLNRKSVVERKD